MILQAFRDLEQRWRNHGAIGSLYAVDLAAVREALEARLEQIQRIDGTSYLMGKSVLEQGRFVYWADLETALGVKELT